MTTAILPPAKGLGYGNVSTAMSESDTSLVLSSGQGARFPDPSGNLDRAGSPIGFYIEVHHRSYSSPHVAYWTGRQAEIMKVTARAGDTLTVERAKGGTSAIAITTDYDVFEAFTVDVYEAIDAAIDAAKIGTYDAREWGIKSTNSDNTDAMNAAILAISNAGGGVLELPAGNFLFASQIVPQSEVTVRGQGMVATALTYTATTGNFIQATDVDVDNFGFEHMRIRADSTIDGSTGWGIYLPQTANTIRRFFLHRVLVAGFTNGVFLKNSVHCHFSHCYVTGRGKTKAGSIGVKLGTDTTIGGALDTSDTGGNSYVALNLYVASFDYLMESAAQNALIEGPIFEVANEGLRIGQGNTRLVSPYFGSTGSMTTCDIRCMSNGIRIDSYGSQSWNIIFDNTSADVRSVVIPERMDFVPGAGNKGFRVSRFHIYNNGDYCTVSLGRDDIVGFRDAADNSGTIDTSFQRDSAGVLKFNQSVKVAGALVISPTQKTVSATAIDVTGVSLVEVNSASPADLYTATGGVNGQVLIIKLASGSDVVTVKDSTGNDTFATEGSVDLALSANDRIEFLHNGTKWFEVSRSVN